MKSIHILDKKLIVNEQGNGLKGQYNLARGKRNVALGWNTDKEIVRARTFIKEKLLFRTREMAFCFSKMMFCNSVRKEFFALFIESSRTAFLLHPLPRATFRFVPPSTYPGLNHIGLSGRKIHAMSCL